MVFVGRPDLDLENPAGFRGVIDAITPDLVINAAAFTEVDRQENEVEKAFRINAEAPAELARLTRLAGIPIIQISTDYVYEGISSRPYVETDLANPRTVYGRSKLAGEMAVRAGNPDHLVVRTAWVMSPYGQNFVKTMLKLAHTRRVLKVVADQFGSPTLAHDVADGLIAATIYRVREGRFPGALYHLAGRGRTCWAELAQHVMDTSRAVGGPWSTIEHIPGIEWPANAMRPKNSELNSDAFLRDFALQPGDWRERIQALVIELVKDK